MNIRRTADNHVHTRFSPDGHDEPEEFILRALSLGLKHIAFTEHVDLLYYMPQFSHGDLHGYFACVRALQKKYAPRIYVGAGLEMGYTPQNKEENAACIAAFCPDYVIQSVHQVGDCDCYFPEYFTGKTPAEAYDAYLRQVRESLDATYPYHTVGHLGYVCRNAPFDEGLLSSDAPAERAALIDDILRTIVRKGKILEINTSCRKPSLGSIPEKNVLLRYVELGGKKVCFSSDAHRPEDLCRSYETFVSLCARLGISEQTAVQNGKEVLLPI